jgi:hypothetical protein
MGRKLRIAGRILGRAGRVARGTPGEDGWGKPKKPSTAWEPRRGRNNDVWNKPRKGGW